MRPKTTKDLPDYQVEGPEIISVNSGKLPMRGNLLRALGDFIEAAERCGLRPVTKYDRTVLHATPSDEELADKLESAQRSWDTEFKLYRESVEAQEVPANPTNRQRVEIWCSQNEVTVPWTEEDKGADAKTYVFRQTAPVDPSALGAVDA